MKVINLMQNSPEWRQFRRDKIGASDAPIIMGVSPYKTKKELWQEKINETESIPHPGMIRGAQLEAEVRDIYNQMNPNSPCNPIVVQHDEYPWMIASLDGWDGENVIEIKCPKKEDHMQAVLGHVPEKYYPQIQHQLFVTGAKKCIYLSYDGEKVAIAFVVRNEDYMHEMFMAEKEFLGCITNCIPPEGEESNLQEIVQPRAKEMAERREELKKLIKAHEFELDMIEKTLIECCNDEDSRVGNISITKAIRKGAIDYGKIEELKSLDLERYRRDPTTYWKFSKIK